MLRFLPDRRIDFPKRPPSRICHSGFLCAFVGPEDKFNEWIKLPWWRRVISAFDSQDKDVVNRLNLFINAHLDHHLSFVNDGECEYDDPTLED